MSKKYSYFLVGLAFALGASTPVSGEEYYKGKTVQFIVGFSPGGGYDTYTRLIARHISKYIPGNPTPIVQNMTGAGSLIAANYIAKRARPDGLTGAIFNNSLIVQKALGDKNIRIDFQKLGWVGAPSQGELVCMIMGFTGVKTLKDVLNSKKHLKMGATRAGSTGHDIAAIMNKTMGTKFKIVTGYRGTATIRIALESREVDGFCSQWESMRVTARSLLDNKGDAKLIPYIIHTRSFKDDPELKGLPLFRDSIKGKKNLEIFESWASQMAFQRPLALPPGVPRDRLTTLRKAYAKTLKDPQLLKEAKKSKILITAVSGQKVTELVKQIMQMPNKVKESLSFLVRKKK
jgi:tripartite-type tricarboxylate transporter receptor subunit TctC